MNGTAARPALSYDELDEYLRGGGHHDAVGMSAIDGLIAALVAGPAFVHPDEWLPLIFAGRRPRPREGSPQHRAVQAIFHRYDEVATTLAERPQDYCPIFMIDDDNHFVVNPWASGFILGIALCRQDWAISILLTPHRHLLVPILIAHPVGAELLPELRSADQVQQSVVAWQQIPAAVAAVRRVCNPHRAAQAAVRPARSRRARHAKR